MSNSNATGGSGLVVYTKLSPHCNKPRKYNGRVGADAIDTITIHHMAGTGSIETCGAIFAEPTRNGSSNYGVGSDGRIGLYVEEANRAWCSSSPENDHRAVTIEVANDEIGGNWHVSDTALSSLIKLCADICKRNGIAKLNYTGDKSGNLTMHKWFAATACPGPYLESKFPYIASEVNKLLGTATTKPLDRYVSNGLTLIKAKQFKVVYYDGAKNNYGKPNYINASFFGTYDNGITLPAGIVCADINLPKLSDTAQYYLKKFVTNNKLHFECQDNFSSQFKGKKVSTLWIDGSGKPHIGEYGGLPIGTATQGGVEYAISGVPVIRNGIDVSYTNFVLPQGWDGSCMYATHRNFLGLKNNEVWIMSGATATSNYVSTSEVYNKLKNEGFTDVICLDGGGSYVIVENGKNTLAMSGNRRINTVIEF